MLLPPPIVTPTLGLLVLRSDDKHSSNSGEGDSCREEQRAHQDHRATGWRGSSREERVRSISSSQGRRRARGDDSPGVYYEYPDESNKEETEASTSAGPAASGRKWEATTTLASVVSGESDVRPNLQSMEFVHNGRLVHCELMKIEEGPARAGQSE